MSEDAKLIRFISGGQVNLLLKGLHSHEFVSLKSVGQNAYRTAENKQTPWLLMSQHQGFYMINMH